MPHNQNQCYHPTPCSSEPRKCRPQRIQTFASAGDLSEAGRWHLVYKNKTKQKQVIQLDLLSVPPSPIIGRSCHNYRFCRGKSLVMTKRLFPWQKYACRAKTFVATKLYLSKQNSFVATKDVFCHDKHVFVMTKPFVLTKMLLVAAPANDNPQPQHNILRVRVPPAQFPWS